MKKMNKTPFAAAMGTAVMSSFAVTAAHAEANPFGMTELSSGYMQMAAADQAGEMKCGANMGGDAGNKAATAKKEGSCGEGKCGGSMNMGVTKMPEGKCAGQKTEKKAKEAACGEGKCGAMMDNGKMKKGMEGACGDMMKGKEGACGEKVSKDKAAGK